MLMTLLRVLIDILMVCSLIFYGWQAVCFVVGFLSKKNKWPEQEPEDLAVLICARNEEAVVTPLIQSLLEQDYPKEKREIFLVAHNCTDHTAEVARRAGARVFERTNPSETHKGDAIRFGIRNILELYPDRFKGLVIFDADNLADPGFLREINNGLASGADVIQGYRRSKNYYTNVISEMFSIMWLEMANFQNLPHGVMGLPVIIHGTGFGVRMSILKEEGWNTSTLIEDMEFSIQQTIAGRKQCFAPYAVFYDEQPVNAWVGIKQRYRWCIGNAQCFRKYMIPLLKAVPKQGLPALKLVMDNLVNPILIMTFILGVLQTVEVFITKEPLLQAAAATVISGAVMLAGTLLLLSALLIREKQPLHKNILALLLFSPYIATTSIIFALMSIFVRDTAWVPIRHTESTSIEEVKEEVESQEAEATGKKTKSGK